MDAQEQSLWHREQERKSQDIHRVKNPRNEDYKLVWSGYIDTIPANGTADLPTYKVDKYLREMTDLILLEEQEGAVKKENEARAKRGEKPMEKWAGEAQQILESKFALTEGVGSMEARGKVYKELYVGLVKEYGIEKVEQERIERLPSTHQQLMSQILGTKAPVVESKAPIVSETANTPLQEMTQFELRKVAKEKGIETQKTDKKDALIEMISQK